MKEKNNNNLIVNGLTSKESKNLSLYYGKTMEILGDRKYLMEYEKGEYNFKYPYIVEILKYSTDTLGIQVAASLQTLIPNCNNESVTNKRIKIIDIINPNSIPGITWINDEDNNFESIDLEQYITFFQDERFLVVICDDEVEVTIYCYEK